MLLSSVSTRNQPLSPALSPEYREEGAIRSLSALHSIHMHLIRRKPVLERAALNLDLPRFLKHHDTFASRRAQSTELHLPCLPLALRREDEDFIPHLAHAEIHVVRTLQLHRK